MLGELQQSIRDAGDLRSKRVLTLVGCTSAAYLDEQLIHHRTAPSLDEALQRVADGEADAMVYDAPILRYLVNERHDSRLRVLPTVFARQDYGIALPAGSPLRERLNRRILRIVGSPEWASLLKGYFGPDG